MDTPPATTHGLDVRWLGRVPYREALAVQQALFDRGRGQHLLLLEHDHVFTYGRHADLATNLRCDPAAVDADLVAVSRGGDITYHGPGQLVGYPIVNVDSKFSVVHVRAVEDLLIAVIERLGLPGAGRLADYPGVWVDADGPNPRKIAAIGVRIGSQRNGRSAPFPSADSPVTIGRSAPSRRTLRGIGRTMHGFALNNTTDMAYMREHIVACGIPDRPVTSLAEEGIDVTMREIVDVVAELATDRWGGGVGERHDVAWQHRTADLTPFSRGEGPGETVTFRPRSHARLEAAGVTEGLSIETRKPEWLRPKVRLGPEVVALKKTMRELDLVTVCEDAGCPNLSECWSDGTATFMVLGERCTRACGFCLVDTRKPLDPATDEPQRVAEAVDRMALDHAVLTMVARDDLPDGGMAHVARCVEAIRLRRPATRVETLISDAKGSRDALEPLFAVRPDVLNHNVETVPRLQRAVRPSAGYARSLAVLAWAKQAGLVTKSSLMVGLGETDDEVLATLTDLAGIGCDIVTIGQYLRPTTHHLPVARWVAPVEFARWKQVGESFGIGHVEASPLTRSSYHAKQAAAEVTPVAVSQA